MPRLTVVALIAVLLTTPIAPAADPPPPQPYPRIGLVLSGGGALGLAHVGVLKVLEEYGVPVHAVAGTSMGAIVGGTYAAGYSAAEVEQLVLTTDWVGLLDDRPPRRDIPYRRKVDDFRYLTRLELGFNHGRFQAPRGLIAGQQFGFELQKILLHTAGIESFDELPIPFRAVAADIENGDMVVLNHGSLAQAIRASMSVPGVFSPVEIDGRLLVDGGIVRNLPIDVMRAMGVDVVIAVDIAPPLDRREQLDSMVEVTSQMVRMVIRANAEQQGYQADVLIRPDVTGFGSTDFDRAAELIPRGEAAARSLEPILRAFALPAAEYQRYHHERFEQPRSLPERVASVQLAIGSTAEPEFVLDRVRTRPGDPFDPERIAADLRRLYATGDYELVDVVVTASDGDAVLHVTAHDKSWGPNFVRFGLFMNADFEGDSSFNILANYTMTRLNSWRGEAKFAGQIGEEPRVAAELYQPLGADSLLFVSPWAERVTRRDEGLVDPSTYASYRTDVVRGGLDLGLALGRFGEIRCGLFRGLGHAEPQTGPAGLQGIDVDWGGYRLGLAVDQVDNPRFPRRGYSLGATFEASRQALGADLDADRLELFMLGATSFGRHTVAGFATLGSALGSALPFYDQFETGGLFQLSGLPFSSVRGRYGGTLTTLYFIEVARLGSGVGGGVYAGISLEAGNYWLSSSDVAAADLVRAASLFVGADTLLGPVYLGYGRASSGADAFYLFVGTWLN